MNPEWLENYEPISKVFEPYGWFVAPFVIGAEFREIKALASRIPETPPENVAARLEIENEIYRVLCVPAFSSVNRTRATWYGNQLNHFKDFNHLYESAIFSYYKRNYAQSVLCLLAALEGILLSFFGYKPGKEIRKPSFDDLVQKIRGTETQFPKELSKAHSMYRVTLSNFLEKWLYKNTRHADFSISVLNRHYVLHGIEPGNFYRPQDAHRLILAFDLLIEFLSLTQGVFHTFMPDEGTDKFYDDRRIYYQELSLGGLSVAECWIAERKLLKQHRSYIQPDHDPSIADVIAANLALQLRLNDITRKRSP